MLLRTISRPFTVTIDGATAITIDQYPLGDYNKMQERVRGFLATKYVYMS